MADSNDPQSLESRLNAVAAPKDQPQVDVIKQKLNEVAAPANENHLSERLNAVAAPVDKAAQEQISNDQIQSAAFGVGGSIALPYIHESLQKNGPKNVTEEQRSAIASINPEQRHGLLKQHPWVYNSMTPQQQDEDFEFSRKAQPFTMKDAGEAASGLGNFFKDMVSKGAEVSWDVVAANLTEPLKARIENIPHNDRVKLAEEKLARDSVNLGGSIPSGIIDTTRTIQRLFGGEDLNALVNPIQRAIQQAAPVIGQQLGIPIGVTQNIVGVPQQQQINPWSAVPSTGYAPFDLVTRLAEASYSKDAGSFAALDRFNEAAGLQDKDQSKTHDHIRKVYNAIEGEKDWNASVGQNQVSPWAKMAFSDAGHQAILFREKSMLPSAQFIADHDGISLQEADAKRDRLAEENATKATIQLASEWNKNYDPAMEMFGGLLLGDAGMGEAGLAMGALKESGSLMKVAQTLGKTDREVSAYYTALQKSRKARDLEMQAKASRMPWWGKAAGGVEQVQKNISAAGQGVFENLPPWGKTVAPLASKVAAKVGLGGLGGGVGALLDPENPTKGLLEGVTFATALGIAPSVIRSIGEAKKTIGAGEGKLFTEVAKSPTSSLPARVIFNKATGPTIDYLIENGTTLAKAGVNLGALSAVTSTLNSDDPEDFNKAVAEGIGMGVGFHLLHGAAGQIHGKDPAQELKNRKKRDAEINIAVSKASPATQGVLEQVTNYQTAIDRVDHLVGKSQNNLARAIQGGDKKAIDEASKALKNAQAIQKEVLRANVQTRNEYGRSFLSTYADMNRLANGSRSVGQPNVSIEILTPDQIADLHVSENSRVGMTPEEIAAVRAQGEADAQARGFFDKSKNRAVINAAHILARTTLFGESPSDALRHETSHALEQIPEFKKFNEKTDNLLFTNTERDLQGNILKQTDGIYDDNALVEMYIKKYLGSTPDSKKIEFSSRLGLWNPETNSLNIPEVVKYMKSEVTAELTSGNLRSGLGKLMGAEAGVANWIAMRQKQGFLGKAINAVTGLGAKPFGSELLGIEYTPEVIAANREAIKALAEFNGRFELNPEGQLGREMTEKEIRTNPVLRKRYGLTGGEFQTQLQGVIRDENGKIVGKPVVITNPNASEGNWKYDDQGNRKQVKGYGQVPDEFQGVPIPAGGSLEVYRDFKYEPDGKTPIRTSNKDLNQLEADRGDLIRKALTEAAYDDSTSRLTPFSADGLSWDGIMSKSQIQAIKDIPESILPLSIKEKILAFNDAMARGEGSTFDIDYAPRSGRGKAYKGRKSNIYHMIPIGFGFSKAGNFYLRTLSLNAAFRKLNARAKLMKGWLDPWDGDKNLFMKELQDTYLKNTYEKRDGWIGLDPNHPAEKTPLAEVKFGRFLDFMNMIGSDTPINPQRSVTPADPSARKSKRSNLSAEEDNAGIDNLWRSHRLDAIADIADTTEQTGAYKMDLNRVYKALMPKPEEGEEAIKPLTFAPKGERPALTPEILKGITATHIAPKKENGISFMPSDEKYPTSERGFYSGLQKTIDEKMPAKASPQQILSIVNNPQNAKPEEVKWSNLAGFVEGKTSVTKQEVLDYLRNEGSVKFEEVSLKKGGGQDLKIQIQENLDAQRKYFEDAFAKYGVSNIRDLPNEVRFSDERKRLEEEGQRLSVERTNQSGRIIQEPKYSQYVLPNGENYREVVLTMPVEQKPIPTTDINVISQEMYGRKYSELSPEEGDKVWSEYKNRSVVKDAQVNPYAYRSSHFPDIPNYVAHMRVDERPDAEGNDGLFIEEIQSDRHQQGREKGYRGNKDEEIAANLAKQKENVAKMEVLEKQLTEKYGEDRNAWDKSVYPRDELWHEWKKLHEINKLLASEKANLVDGLIPDAPFRKDWPVQMFKRALRDAVESGKEWIGWTGGETQAERYDLSKQVSSLHYDEKDNSLIAYGMDGEQVIGKTVQTSELPDMIGKDAAQKLLSQAPNGDGEKILSGQDLKVGGEGMKGFYDNILPKEIGKYVKKWGAKVEEGEVDNRQPEDNAYYEEPKPEHFTPIWKVQITPEMRSSIKEGGQIAFMPSREEEPERIKEATYTNPRSGEVSRGATHLIANPNAPQEATDRESPAYGFETDKGRIVDRNEAYSIAQTAGQLKEPTNKEERFHADRGVLHSGMYEPNRISFLPSSKMDEAYEAAVRAGDETEQRRLVDEAAKEAGYTVKAYHGTNKNFRVFKAQFGNAIWFSENRKDIESGESGAASTKKIMPVYLNTGREAGRDEYERLTEGQLMRDYDSVNLEGTRIVFDPSRIKSYDEITKSKGKLIPLSQRFDTSKPDIRFMPADELPKTEDGKVDWESFKTKGMEIAKPLAALAPIGGISFMPAQDIEMKPSDDGRTIVYQHDKKTTIKPPVKSVKTLKNEIVGMLEADRHNTLGDNMGGPMHPFLLSNQAIAKLKDGRGFKPVWANMNSAFVTRAKNIIKNTTSGRALIQLMKEEAHISNRKFVRDVMSELDKKKDAMPKQIVDSLHVILELGARNPATKLKEVTKAKKAFKDGEITQRELNKVLKDNKEAIDKYGPMVDFLSKLGSIKSKATRGNIESFNKSYADHIKQYQKQDWYKKIADKYKNTAFADEAARFTFNQRGAAMKRLRGIAHAPDIGKMLADSMDFKGGKNLDLVASVQLSKDPDAFAIYTGNDPKQETKMSQNERYLRDQFLKNKNFRKHPSYDWMMLGPEKADNFILEKPVDPLVLFPDYAKSHPNANVRNGSKETIVGTMKKSKIPLKIK